MAYGLGSKGSGLVKERLGASLSEPRWGEKNRAVGRMFLQHALLVSDILVSVELACRERNDVRYIPQHELFREAIRWHVKIDRGRKLGVIPDAAFALEKTTYGMTERAYFFLEADRGTMPVTRKNLAQTSFHRKLLAYEATWSQEIHRTHFGFNRFRVLTITTSEERVTSLASACSKLKSGRGIFLFAHESILRCPDLLTTHWQTGKHGRASTLLS